jgi:hypothetical protein
LSLSRLDAAERDQDDIRVLLTLHDQQVSDLRVEPGFRQLNEGPHEVLVAVRHDLVHDLGLVHDVLVLDDVVPIVKAEHVQVLRRVNCLYQKVDLPRHILPQLEEGCCWQLAASHFVEDPGEHEELVLVVDTEFGAV